MTGSDLPPDILRSLVGRYCEAAAAEGTGAGLAPVAAVSRQWRDEALPRVRHRGQTRLLLGRHGVAGDRTLTTAELERRAALLQPGPLAGRVLHESDAVDVVPPWAPRADWHTMVHPTAHGFAVRWSAPDGLVMTIRRDHGPVDLSYVQMTPATAECRRSCTAWSSPQANTKFVAAVSSWEVPSAGRTFALSIWRRASGEYLGSSDRVSRHGHDCWQLDDSGIVAVSPNLLHIISWGEASGWRDHPALDIHPRWHRRRMALAEDKIWMAPAEILSDGSFGLKWTERDLTVSSRWQVLRVSTLSPVEAPRTRWVGEMQHFTQTSRGGELVAVLPAGADHLAVTSISANRRFLSLAWTTSRVVAMFAAPAPFIPVHTDPHTMLSLFCVDGSTGGWQVTQRSQAGSNYMLHEGLLVGTSGDHLVWRQAGAPVDDEVTFERWQPRRVLNHLGFCGSSRGLSMVARDEISNESLAFELTSTPLCRYPEAVAGRRV